MNIGGIQFEIGIKLNSFNQKDYFDVLVNLEDKIAQIIESEGHELMISSANPIPKEELN